ncbi:hypothetical protein IWW48_003306 [Coemansia sp. RSA 1200]|nr:hypothetical protein IWW48_003306 [Coemansia sp. RSA 1200]
MHKFEKYDPSVIESDWYEWWQKQGLFKPSEKDAQCTSRIDSGDFSMLLPPPNVTGVLHIGHALTLSIQDAIARWNRMNGRSVNWVPGTDHAGISLQSVVEKRLKREFGKTRHDLGRKEFLDLVWEYKRNHGDQIKKQTMRIGASLNWDSEYFTMDAPHSQTVRDAFIRLYDDGLVYRATKMVNWSCALQSVISDIEVDKIPTNGSVLVNVPNSGTRVEFGVLHTIMFPIVNPPEAGPNAICVETTRPETMLGDTALAVSPTDIRYKITPAHDADDYACARRHGLPVVQVFGNDGRIVDEPGIAVFVGKSRWEARKMVIKQLTDSCAYLGKRDADESVISVCSRSGDVIEPMLMPQWYIRCEKLGQNADSLVASGDIDIVPARQKAVWHSWMSGITDWCVSRQLWWGHRIPMYYVCWNSAINRTGSWVAATDENQAREKALGMLTAAERTIAVSIERDAVCTISHDEDVLDTWFSSGLLPLTIFNNTRKDEGRVLEPCQSTDIFERKKALTALLETGQDILFFWVARMVILCSHFAKIPPFSTVLLHSMVRDAQGRKMSKSLGNIIDPMDIINGAGLSKLEDTVKHGNLSNEELRNSTKELRRMYPQGFQRFGADALRFTLILYTQQTHQINLSLDNVRASYAVAAEAVRDFVQRELCDRYIEVSKAALFDNAKNTTNQEPKCVTKIMFVAIDIVLRALHPFMPFLSEELWQRHARRDARDDMSVMQSGWQAQNSTGFVVDDLLAENETGIIFSVVSGIRSLRQQHSVHLELPTDGGSTFTVAVGSLADMQEQQKVHQMIMPHIECIRMMSREQGVCIRALEKEDEFGKTVSTVAADRVVTVVVSPHVQVFARIAHRQERVPGQKPARTQEAHASASARLEMDIAKLCRMIDSDGYKMNAPRAVKEMDR